MLPAFALTEAFQWPRKETFQESPVHTHNLAFCNSRGTGLIPLRLYSCTNSTRFPGSHASQAFLKPSQYLNSIVLSLARSASPSSKALLNSPTTLSILFLFSRLISSTSSGVSASSICSRTSSTVIRSSGFSSLVVSVTGTGGSMWCRR